MIIIFRFQLILFFLLFLGQNCFAHKLQVEPIIAVIRPQKSFLTVELRGNGEDVVQAVQVRDTERTTNSLAQSVWPRFENYVNDKFQLNQGDQKLRGKIVSLNYSRPDTLDYQTSKFSAIFRYERPQSLQNAPFKIQNALFDYLPNAATVISLGGVQKTIETGATLDYDPSQLSANLLNNIWDFAKMGVEHIFTGPDHMLFILALLLTSTSLLTLTKTLTGFTIAHSITLILSALSVVVLPNRLVDIFIALSIMWVGLENIFLPNAARYRFFLAAGFGLIHGFGFSYTLRDIGLPQEGLAWCLLSFNLGVEIAQVALCVLAWPITRYFQKKFEREAQYGGMGWPKVVRFVSGGVVAAGAYWLLERVAGV